MIVFSVSDDDATDRISAFFVEDDVQKPIKFVKFNFCGDEQECLAGCFLGAADGRVMFSLGCELMGSSDWNHTAFYDADTDCMKLTNGDYRYKEDRYFTLKNSTFAYDSDGKKVTLKKGLRLIPVRSDVKKYLYMKDESGTLLRFDAEPYEWYYKINGIPQDDLFEDIGYYG